MVTVVDEITALAAAATRFEAGFLAKCPIPMIDDPVNPGLQIPEFASPKLWLRAWLIRNALRASRHGHDLIAQQTAVIINDDDLA